MSHRVQWRRLVVVAFGVCLMLAGSGLASVAHELQGASPLVIDAVAYFLHGVGTLPVLHHIEPLLAAVVGE